MEERTLIKTDLQFAQEVKKGLTDFPKHLSSKFIYDQNGDRIFQKIMEMPSYYLTNCEYDTLKRNRRKIVDLFTQNSNSINLIELGAGDGKKTKLLLEELSKGNTCFKYSPIDISQNALDLLQSSLSQEYPNIKVDPYQGTYIESLKTIGNTGDEKKIILFLGSNIGNLLHEQAVLFLQELKKTMKDEDMIFLGCDQKKDPQTILDAYNDPEGITEAFNKNILARINTELEGNFNLDKFKHWEVYDPQTGTAKSYLVSIEPQDVSIKALDLELTFAQWETIHTEISQKYDDLTINALVDKAGLKIARAYADDRDYFKNYILVKK
ncbi:L-histidine N(alpha)-methyltransferase [Arenibacter aquaticus]|uniref:L-histidine N(Alpha)-methyltransferase n=1 Tax=Arenibacter aquaticus TaxID=2489054 RepID=A0A3S0ADB6_9FLAO|nr:L-histidine N(alpha)-methyltransferase [Arenibacter aquaticus]RTE52898.1 L-histidine N(alpha)-methyltransferase [Arenibacter aquaticus]